MYVCWGFCMIESLLCVEYQAGAFVLSFLTMCMGMQADYVSSDGRGSSRIRFIEQGPSLPLRRGRPSFKCLTNANLLNHMT